jgi:hypothetical protein
MSLPPSTVHEVPNPMHVPFTFLQAQARQVPFTTTTKFATAFKTMTRIPFRDFGNVEILSERSAAEERPERSESIDEWKCPLP